MINGKLLFVIGLQTIFVYGQPIFTPMAGQFGLPLDTLGAATGYAGGGAGFPLLSPMELNAIMAAQVRGGNFKSAFTPDTEPQGYSGYSGFGGNNNGFMPNFEEGFNNDGNSEFYEAPQHGEPFPVQQEAEPQMKKPEPKGRDNRGRYHKDEASEGPVEGEHSEGPQEPRHEQNPRHHQAHRESGPSNGQSHQRGAYREEERESVEPNYNEPASGGAYREYRGSSGPSSAADEGSDGPEGNPGSPGSPGSPEPYSREQERETYRDEAPEHFRDNSRLRHNN